MTTVHNIFEALDRKAPFSLQMDFDNAGFLVGRGGQEVTTLLVALDVTEEVVKEAAALGAQLIVTHHPVIFFPVKHVTDADPTGRKLLALAEHGIAAICAHTNLDAVADGVNDQLARTLGLQKIEQLHQDGVDPSGVPYGIGRVGEVPAVSLPDFAAHVKRCLHTEGVRVADAGRKVHRVAVGGGSCGSMLGDVLAKGCDTFVTADVKYDTFLDAKAQGINLIDAGHFATENVVCPMLAEYLKSCFPQVTVYQSERHREVFSTL